MNLGDRLMLILEDEPIIAFDLEDALLAEGAEVTVAATNDQALASILENDFGGAILDVNLHGETSYPRRTGACSHGDEALFDR